MRVRASVQGVSMLAPLFTPPQPLFFNSAHQQSHLTLERSQLLARVPDISRPFSMASSASSSSSEAGYAISWNQEPLIPGEPSRGPDGIPVLPDEVVIHVCDLAPNLTVALAVIQRVCTSIREGRPQASGIRHPSRLPKSHALC